jgi:hypothetical protein
MGICYSRFNQQYEFLLYEFEIITTNCVTHTNIQLAINKYNEIKKISHKIEKKSNCYESHQHLKDKIRQLIIQYKITCEFYELKQKTFKYL